MSVDATVKSDTSSACTCPLVDTAHRDEVFNVQERREKTEDRKAKECPKNLASGKVKK